MADFLSDEWVQDVNDRLAQVYSAGAPLDKRTISVVFDLTDAPTAVAHALTFALDESGASIRLGDDLAADLVVRLTFDDARQLSANTLFANDALRGGRLKIRGDVSALNDFGAWMQAARRTEA